MVAAPEAKSSVAPSNDTGTKPQAHLQLVQEIEQPQLAKQEVVTAIATPAPKPPQNIPQNAGCEAYRAEIAKYNWNINVAMAVMKAESGCRTTAVNNNPRTRDYSIGLFQINIYGANARTRPSEAQLKDPATNIAWAYKLYSGNGNSFIGQWGVCRSMVRCY